MGISSTLRTFIKARAKSQGINISKTHSINRLREKSIAIDAYLYIHTLYHGIKNKIRSVENFDQSIFKLVITEILKQENRFREIQCYTVYVFENQYDDVVDAKQSESTSRKLRIDKAKNKYESLKTDKASDSDILKAFINSKRPNKDFMDRVLEVLNSMKYMTIVCGCEGEKYCVMLYKHSKVDYVYSKDSDCLAMGSRYIITNINFRSGSISVMYLTRVLKVLDIEFNKFLDLCILCGCDFNTNIPNLGPSRAYNLIQNRSDYSNIYSLVGDTVPKVGVLTREMFDCVKYETCVDMFNVDLPLELYTIKYSKYYRLYERDKIDKLLEIWSEIDTESVCEIIDTLSLNIST